MLNNSFLLSEVILGAFSVMTAISAVMGKKGLTFLLHPRWLSKSLFQWSFITIAAALSFTFAFVYLNQQQPRSLFILLVPVEAALGAVFLWAPHRNMWVLIVAILVYFVFYVYVYGSKLLS